MARPDNYDEDVIFTYHKPQPGQVDTYAQIRATANAFALALRAQVPIGRELALSRTKLEECVMWANAGIARAPARQQPVSTAIDKLGTVHRTLQPRPVADALPQEVGEDQLPDPGTPEYPPGATHQIIKQHSSEIRARPERTK